METKEIENLKQDLLQEIQEKGYLSLKYVLFNEQDRTPYAVHIFYRQNVFMVNSRDDRSYVNGKHLNSIIFRKLKINFYLS